MTESTHYESQTPQTDAVMAGGHVHNGASGSLEFNLMMLSGILERELAKAHASYWRLHEDVKQRDLWRERERNGQVHP